MVTLTTTTYTSPLCPNIQCIKVKQLKLVYWGAIFKSLPHNIFLTFIIYSFHQHKLERREHVDYALAHMVKSIYL